MDNCYCCEAIDVDGLLHIYHLRHA